MSLLLGKRGMSPKEAVGELRRKSTYAKVVKGDALKKDKDLRLHTEEYGNGDFMEDLQNRGLQNIEVKEGGGRMAFVTFSSVQAMRNRSSIINKWIED
ncbi:unnamed protein product [Camellia sinensis]